MTRAQLRQACAVCALLTALALTGCAGGFSSSPLVKAPVRANDSNRGVFAASPGAPQQLIYGCAVDSTKCVWYVKGNSAIAGQITDLSDPDGIGVDPRTGNLFIANTGASNIAEYAPGSPTRIATFADIGQYPVDAAVGANGNVYVANFSTTNRGPGSISVFDASGNLLRTLADPRVLQGVSVTIDEHNDLVFCFKNTSRVGECDDFPNARGSGVERASGWRLAGGSTFDAQEHLVEVDQRYANILTYSGSTRCGKAAITGSPVPLYIALDRSNRLIYAADAGTGIISAYGFVDCANGSLALRARYNADHSAGILLSVAVTPGVTP